MVIQSTLKLGWGKKMAINPREGLGVILWGPSHVRRRSLRATLQKTSNESPDATSSVLPAKEAY